MEEKKKYNHIEIINEGGLKCDNLNCDYVNNNIKFDEYKDWIDKPCPKCGENLLTKEDYINTETLKLTIDIINSMTKEELDKFINSIPEEQRENFLKTCNFTKEAEGLDDINTEDKVKMTISTHKEVKVIKIEKTDNNLEK